MKQLRRLVISIAGGAALAACTFPGVLVAAPPDSSGIVVRFDDVFVVGYQDPADGLVAIAGPPLELLCQGLGLDEFFTEIQVADTPSGAVTFHVRVADIPIHVYRGSSIGELCDEVLAGGTLDLVGSGAGRVTGNDNDLFVSESRTNSWGDALTGTVTSADGTRWSVAAAFRQLVEGTEDGQCICRTIREDVTLAQRGG
jgi:hypothetical protein